MTSKAKKAGLTNYIPQYNIIIFTPRCKQRPKLVIPKGSHSSFMPIQCRFTSSFLKIPNSNATIRIPNRYLKWTLISLSKNPKQNRTWIIEIKIEIEILPGSNARRQWRWRREKDHEKRKMMGLGFWCKRLVVHAKPQPSRVPELEDASLSYRRRCLIRRKQWHRRPPLARTSGKPWPWLWLCSFCYSAMAVAEDVSLQAFSFSFVAGFS